MLSVLTVTGIASYWLLTDPLEPLNELFRTWFEVVISVILLFGVVFLGSRSFYDEMDEDAFGWAGLIRWASLGTLTGLTVSLIHRYTWSRVKDNALLETLFQLALPVLLFLLLYWLIFRRNPFARSRSVPKGGPSIASTRWVLIIGGVFVLVIGFVFLFVYAHGQTKPVLLGIGLVMMGWCAVLYGAMTHRGHHDGLERRLSGWAGILSVIALIVLLAGMLWP
jgi:hypothetical protein